MIRANNASRAFQKRTIRPLYAWHSAVPYACFLDTVAVGTAIVYPGQVAVKTTGEQMSVANATAAGLPGLGTDATAADVPFGLFNNFINGTMDELHGGTEIGVWVGGRDAVFEILSGYSNTETPLSTAVTWTSLNATRGGVALYGENTTGRLTNTTTGFATLEVARLIEAVSNTKIVVQLTLRTS